MSYLKPLLTLGYWFSLTPPPFLKSVFIGLGIVLVVLLAAGIVIKWFAYKKRSNPPLHRVLSRVGRAYLTVSLLGLLLYFFAYEQTMFVSARFWWLLLFVVAVVWKVYIILDILKRYPVEKKVLQEKQAREKYLPK